MSPALAQRAVALAGVALLAAVIALALTGVRDGEGKAERPLPTPVPAADGGWYRALAAPRREPDGRARPTACGLVLGPSARGVAHPVLPCGAKLFIAYGDLVVLTQVVARGPSISGPQFALTSALARRLGVRGVRTIRWRFASAS